MVLLAYYLLLYNCIYFAVGHSLFHAKNLIHAKKTCIIKLQYHFTLHVFSKMYGFYFFCFFFSVQLL